MEGDGKPSEEISLKRSHAVASISSTRFCKTADGREKEKDLEIG